MTEWGNTINEVYPNIDPQGNVISNQYRTSSNNHYDGMYDELLNENEFVKSKKLSNIDNYWNNLNNNQERKQEPIDQNPKGTQFFTINFNDGSIKKLPQETPTLRVICRVD